MSEKKKPGPRRTGVTSTVHRVPDAPGGELRWSPMLDLRNCGMDAVRRAVTSLERSRWEAWMVPFLGEVGVTHNDVGRACLAYVQSLKAVVVAGPIDLVGILRDSGFAAAHPRTQALIFCQIGRQMMGMSILGMTTTLVDPSGSYAASLAALGEAAEATAATLMAAPAAGA